MNNFRTVITNYSLKTDAILREVTTRAAFAVDGFPRRVAVIWLLFNYPILWELKPARAGTSAPLFYLDSFAFSSRRTIKPPRIKDNRSWQSATRGTAES